MSEEEKAAMALLKCNTEKKHMAASIIELQV